MSVGARWLLVCVALAVVSWTALPTIPSYDPYSWIIWGHEVTDPHLAFAVFDGPSFKPLPFAFTVVYGLFGSASPTLWVITARAAGLLGLVAAWRLAARLAGGGRWGAFAGALAAAGVVLTYDWPYDMLRGASEPGLVAATLWSIDCLLRGRRRAAFWLWVAVALLRPEAWPLLAGLAAWLAWRGRSHPPFAGWLGRGELLAGLALVPLGWFGVPWLGGGHPLLAAHNAAVYDGMLGADPVGTEIGRLVGEQPWPLLVAGLGLAIAAGVGARRRRLVVGGLAGFVVVWWAIVVVMAAGLGYPGLERFFLPAAAVACVLGGAGIAELARLAGGAVGDARAAAVASVVLVGLTVLGSLRPIDVLPDYVPEASLAVRTIGGLDSAVAAAGGRDAVLPCRRSFVAVNHAAQPALAWRLGVGLPRVGTAVTRAGLDFIGPANRATGVPAAIAPALVRGRLVARSGRWSVYALSRRAGSGEHCVGR